MSDYRDEDAESDEIDETTGRNLEIRIKKLVAHDNDIKQIDIRVGTCTTETVHPDQAKKQIDRKRLSIPRNAKNYDTKSNMY